MQIIASVDTETGGLDPIRHSILSLCVLPLNSDFTINNNITPLKLFMYNPDFQVEPDALRVNKLYNYLKFPSYKDSFIGFLKWCSDNKITGINPMGSNFAYFDTPFLRFWLGNEFKIFKREVRDTKILAEALRDAGLYNGGTGLASLCEYFEVKYEAHTADGDAYAVAQVYRMMIERLKIGKKE